MLSCSFLFPYLFISFLSCLSVYRSADQSESLTVDRLVGRWVVNDKRNGNNTQQGRDLSLDWEKEKEKEKRVGGKTKQPVFSGSWQQWQKKSLSKF